MFACGWIIWTSRSYKKLCVHFHFTRVSRMQPLQPLVAAWRGLQEAQPKHECVFLMRSRSFLPRALTCSFRARWPHFVGVEIRRTRHNCSQSLSWPAPSCHWDSACFCRPVVICCTEKDRRRREIFKSSRQHLESQAGNRFGHRLYFAVFVTEKSFHLCSSYPIGFCNVVVEQLDCFATHWHLTTEQIRRITQFPRQHGLASKFKNSHIAFNGFLCAFIFKSFKNRWHYQFPLFSGHSLVSHISVWWLTGWERPWITSKSADDRSEGRGDIAQEVSFHILSVQEILLSSTQFN